MYVILPEIALPTAHATENDSIEDENKNFARPAAKAIGEYPTYAESETSYKRMAPRSSGVSPPFMQDYEQPQLSKAPLPEAVDTSVRDPAFQRKAKLAVKRRLRRVCRL